MPKALWNGQVIAETDDFVHVEGNVYFPLDAVKMEFLTRTEETKPTYCHWKGIAEYYDVTVDGKTAAGGAWYYDKPYPQAAAIKDHIAFWNGVEVTGAPDGRGQVEGEPSLDGKTGWEALCWLIKFSEDDAIPAAEVERVTGIAPADLADAWQVYDVQRYARHYKRALVTGEDGALTVARSE